MTSIDIWQYDLLHLKTRFVTSAHYAYSRASLRCISIIAVLCIRAAIYSSPILWEAPNKKEGSRKNQEYSVQYVW